MTERRNDVEIEKARIGVEVARQIVDNTPIDKRDVGALFAQPTLQEYMRGIKEALEFVQGRDNEFIEAMIDDPENFMKNKLETEKNERIAKGEEYLEYERRNRNRGPVILGGGK